MLRLRLHQGASSMMVSLTATTSLRGVASSSSSSSAASVSLPLNRAEAKSAVSMLRQVNSASNTFAMRRSQCGRGMNGVGFASASFAVPASAMSQQMRHVRASSSSANDQTSSSSSTTEERQKDPNQTNNNNTEGENKTNENNTENNNTEENAEGAKKKKSAPPKKSFREQFQALKQDIKEFPDIYNSVNLVHFFIFTIFCLCSTGSNVEEQWWMRNWGIDKTFAPWAWPLHSLLTNNFLSMTFAMLLLHSMCHSAMTTLGPKLMWQYMAVVALTSGAMIWGLNSYMGWSHEKQFGPWDVCSALFVMQYLHQGTKPWQLILSFNGWVKYAMCVGSVCILYYDWQPVMFGTGVGLALCKLHPKLRSIKPPTA